MPSDRREAAACVEAILSLWRERGEPLLARLPEALLNWYEAHARALPWRRDREPYHVWLSEIMLQQTRAETVKPYYERFLRAFPDIRALASAKEDEVFKLWEGLGYYSRAKNLQKAARLLVKDFGGRFPTAYDALLTLPGVGEYTAGAIASICFEQPAAAVDGNVLRVVSRVTELFLPIGEPYVRREVHRALSRVYPAERRGDFTQSLMELGAVVCTPAGLPKCGECPANGFCLACAGGTTELLPVRSRKKPRITEEKTVFILSAGESTAVCRREDSGLLAGLWQLPNVSGFCSTEQAADLAADWGVRPLAVSEPLEKKHIFTHREWRMRCYRIRCGAQPPQFTWATEAQLRQEIALPSAFRVCLTQ